VNGVYRDLEQLVLALSKFYLETDSSRKDKLTWFGEKEGLFKVAIGGDGAPFGKIVCTSRDGFKCLGMIILVRYGFLLTNPHSLPTTRKQLP
jgi:hypothetical protein